MPWPRQALVLSLGVATVVASLPLSLSAQTGAAAASAPAAARVAAPAYATPFQAESTKEMAKVLKSIAETDNPYRSPFHIVEVADLLREALAHAENLEQRLKLTLAYADHLLRGGKYEEGLKQYAAYEQLMKDNDRPLTAQLFSMVNTGKAMCYMRMGEEENCLNNHNAESCLFPIRGGGVHQLQRGSRGAIATFLPLLDRFPGDLRARWLLNIAYMTLGEYPDKVPAKWLIDPKLFESEYDIKRFPDVAGSLGIDVEDLAGGVVMDDFDHDGFLDLMVSAWGTSSQLRYFHNNGDGTFTDRTVEAGLAGEVGGLNLIQGDFNNDGFVDVLVLRGAWQGADGHYPNSLLRNNGDGTFTDVTVEAGLLSFHPKQTAVWFDYNGDGWLDLFIGNESSEGDPNPCELFRNNGDGTFTECAAANGVDFSHFVKGVISADYNNDGRPDLYLSRLDGPNILLRNDGPAGPDKSPSAPWKFTNVAAEAGVVEPYKSFSCWFFDYDNDGWPDLMVTGYNIQDSGDIAADYLGLPHAASMPKLYHNRGDGTFADVTQEAGVNRLLHTMGCNFGDLDNDGWLDFYVGTGNPDLTTLIPNRMFRNDGHGHFQDVTTSGGFGQLQKGHGIAFGDINNDGDQDIYSVVGGAISIDAYHRQLFANPGHGNHWLKLNLEGVKTNRVAIGARIKVVVRNDDGERAIYRTVGSGGSFGASPLRQEIGLGQVRAILRVEIFWPVTGLTQTVTGLELDRCYHVREGTVAPTEEKLGTFMFPTAAGAHHHHVHGGAAPVDQIPAPEKSNHSNP